MKRAVSYDEAGRVVRWSGPYRTMKRALSYDEAGRVVRWSGPYRTMKRAVSYDESGRVVRWSGPCRTMKRASLNDEAGLVVRWSGPCRTMKRALSYDEAGRVVRWSGPPSTMKRALSCDEPGRAVRWGGGGGGGGGGFYLHLLWLVTAPIREHRPGETTLFYFIGLRESSEKVLLADDGASTRRSDKQWSVQRLYVDALKKRERFWGIMQSGFRVLLLRMEGARCSFYLTWACG